MTVAPAPAAGGGSTAPPMSSFPDLVRLVLSLSGSVDQRDAVLGSLLSAAAVTSTGGVPAPATTVLSVTPVACLSSVPAPGASTPAGAASATASPGRHERAWESSRLEWRRRRLSGQERSRSGGKRGGGGPLPLLALPIRPVYLPPLPLNPRIRRGGLVRCLLPLQSWCR